MAGTLGGTALTLNGGTLSAGPSGGTNGSGTITVPVSDGLVAPFVIAPGAALASGYGTLNINSLTTDVNTTLLYNLNLASSASLGSGSNGANIYGGDLINLTTSTMTVNGGTIAFTNNPDFNAMGDYRLFAGSNFSTRSPTGLSNFTLPTPTGSNNYTCVLNGSVDTGYIDMVVGLNPLPGPSIWNTGNGNWSNILSWSNYSCAPRVRRHGRARHRRPRPRPPSPWTCRSRWARSPWATPPRRLPRAIRSPAAAPTA